ncbi:MAG TPA: LLM class F420-dependent oxidoreductase [Pseudonocardiaceae bacterium]|nr:LLM class F420-dependent oxidoreductase [Pseudonocardiaceae bacterium]
MAPADGFRLRILMEPRHGADYQRIRALARVTEDAGFDAFFRSDHLMGVDAADPTYRPSDCWTTLAGLARDTSRVRLGALVGAATFRQPGLLATIVATVDDMSGGRVELGLGTGWYEREHEAFGLPFPPVGERFDRLAEQLEIITGLWGTVPGAAPGYLFTGKHYRIDGNMTPPRTVQRPHPPIIIGGSGPRRTPAIAARYAGEFNGALGGDLAERFAVFDAACERIGRDPATARHSAVLPVACGATPAEADRRRAAVDADRMFTHGLVGTPQQVVDRVAQLRETGADTVYFHIYDIDDTDHVALLGADVLPHFVRGGTG